MVNVCDTCWTTLPSSAVSCAVMTWSPGVVGVQEAETVCVAPMAKVELGEPRSVPSALMFTDPMNEIGLLFETMA